MPASTPTVMFVHGAWHGSWCWDLVRERLHADGIATAAVDNPSVTRPGSDLAADGDNLRAALDEITGPVLLVGHSYGGAVVSDAGTHANVQRLVYLTAFPLDTGESVAQNSLLGGEEMKLGEVIQFADDGQVSVDSARSTEFFFHDCPADVATAAVARLRPMSMAAMLGVTRAVAWREKPTTYIVCTDDHAIPVVLQRSAAERAGDVLEMPTSHSPFLSRPDELAALLMELAAR